MIDSITVARGILFTIAWLVVYSVYDVKFNRNPSIKEIIIIGLTMSFLDASVRTLLGVY